MASLGRFLHTVKVSVPDGKRIFTRVELDGKELKGVTRVSFDTGGVNDFSGDKQPTITITLVAEVLFEGALPIDLIRHYIKAPELP